MAYLGKISAVIAANTQDFTKNIGLAKKELTDFSKKVQGIRLNLDTNALDKTLTRLQKFQREVQTIQKLLGKGVDLGFDSKKLNDQFKAFEDIGRPLTKLKDQIEGLSSSLQAELYPELGKIQKGFQSLHNDIGSGVAQYDKSEKRVESLRQALIRLGRATSAAADFGRLAQSLDANNSGASFFQPRAKQALQQSLSLRGQAEQVPARFRGGAFADLAVSAEENANKIEQQAGRIARIQLEIARKGGSQGRSNALAQAESQLDSLTRGQEVINAAFSRQLRGARIAEIVSPEAVSTVDTLVSRLASLSSQLRAINGQQFEGLISGAAKVVSQFNAGETSAKNAKKAVDALASALNSVDTGNSLSKRLGSQLFTDFERQQQRIQSDFDKQQAAGDPAAGVRRRINLGRLNLSENIIPEVGRIQSQAADTGDVELQRRAQKLSLISRQINRDFDKAFNLANSGNIEEANRRLDRASNAISRQGNEWRKLAADIEVANKALSQQNLFLEASGGRGEKLSQGARDAAADISTARQFRGQIASGGSRIAIDGEIGRVTASVTALQKKIAEVANSTLGSDRKAAELDRLDNQIRQSTAGLAAFVASFSGGAFNTQQIQKAMEMARNTAGSLSARSGQVAQLAFQQALFAIDDLVSSTGGLEYKLRAVGNNITQLGLLLGQSGIIPGLSATTGLFIGLATVLGGQAVSAMLRWATGAEEADTKTKLLNESLSKQKSLVEDLAKAFQSLGDSIARDAFSAPGQKAKQFEDDIRSIEKKQRETRVSRVADFDKDVQAERVKQSDLRKELETERDLGARVGIQRRLVESRRREEAAARRAEERGVDGFDVGLALQQSMIRVGESLLPTRLTGQARADAEAGIRRRAGEQTARVPFLPVFGQRDEIEKQIKNLIPITERFSSATTPGRVARREIEQLQQLLLQLEQPLQKALDELSNEILRSSRGVAGTIESAQGDVADAIRRGVKGAAEFQQALDDTARQLDEAQRWLTDAQGIEDPAAREREVRAAEAEIANIRQGREVINERAREVRLGRTFGGERTTSALSSLQGSERFVNEYAALTARVAEAADAEEAARRANEEAIRSGSIIDQMGAKASLEAAQAEGELAAAAAEAALAMEEAVARLRRIADEALSQSEGMANDAQRAFNENPTERSRRDRDDTERQLIEDRRRVAQANNAIDFRRSEAMRSDPQIIAINDELESIKQQREDLAANARLTNTEVDPARSRELADREAQLQAEREQRLFALTEAERRQADAIAQEIDGRRRLIEVLERQRQFDEEVENRRKPKGDPIRGLDLAESPEQRAQRETRQGLADINAASRERGRKLVDEAGGLFDIDANERKKLDENEANRRKAINDFMEQRMRQEAPMIMGMADARQNALLQGPSRAALNVSDVSTMQGQSELNRLLRGDDANKNADLVNLQKEANRLLGVIAEKEAAVAN